jgi:hypothetical protein
VQRWCLGVAETQARLLSEVELEALKERRTRLLLIAVLAPLGATIPLGIAVALVSLGALGLGSGFLVLSLLALALGILSSKDGLWRFLILGKELREPLVAVFETVLDDGRAEEVKATFGLTTAPTAGAFRFEVVLASGRLHSVQGMTSRVFRVTNYRMVAHPPSTVGDQAGGVRALSHEEVQEIQRHATEAWRKPLRDYAGYLALGFIAAVRGPEIYRQKSWGALLAAAFASLGVMAAYHVIHGIRRAQCLRSDLRRGMVVMERVEGGGSAGDPVELLAASKDPWTVGGQPAPWRTSSHLESR